MCIVIDGTSGRYPWIRRAKEGISKIFEEAKKEWKIDIRFAVVVYRDWEERQIHVPRGDHLDILDFTDEVDKATIFLRHMYPDGGGETCMVLSPLPSPAFPLAYGTQKNKGCLGRLTSDPKFKLAITN